MMALTREDLDILKAHFEADEHEFDYNGMAYITELAITERIEQVDPSWSLSEPKLFWRDGLDTSVAEVTIVLTINGVSRGAVGQKEIVASKKGAEANQAAKSAATDALKRAARLFGIGRYLLKTPKWVKDTDTMQKWLNQLNGQPVQRQALQREDTQGKQEWVDNVKNLTHVLYIGSDGKFNEFHQKGSLNKASDNGLIDTSMSPEKAAVTMLMHRIETDYGYKPDHVQQIIGGRVSDFMKTDTDPIVNIWHQVQNHWQAQEQQEAS